jgi:hypothetical protein
MTALTEGSPRLDRRKKEPVSIIPDSLSCFNKKLDSTITVF